MTRRSTILASTLSAAPLFTGTTPGAATLTEPSGIAKIAGHTAPRRVDVQTPLHILIDDLLRRSPWLRRGWRRLLGQHQLSLRIESLPAAVGQKAYVVSETFASQAGVFTTLYVSDGRQLTQVLGEEVYRLVACLEAINSQHG